MREIKSKRLERSLREIARVSVMVSVGLVIWWCSVLFIAGQSILLERYAVGDSPQSMIRTQAVVTDVYDGDTVVVDVTTSIRVRMLDCWAPEIKTKNLKEKEEGLKSKTFLNTMIKNEDVVMLEIPMSGKLSDSLTFGRVLARVYKDVDGDGVPDNLSERMVTNGFATAVKMKGENNEH